MANLPSRIGRYEIQELIGTGGMGVLYRAIDPKIANRPVAIKVLRVDDEEMRLRFEREARMIGLLEHPNIVTVYDVGDHDGQPFIAMKFIPGDTLAERIERHPPMPLVERLVLIEQLCDGLAYAHGRGVIHRDIKPLNLMVHEGTGRLIILDFGIARASAHGTGITQIGKLVGTPRFMSPEQLQGNSIDHRSDIFSVGLVLYELLSCRPAFPGQEAPLVAYRVVHESPQSLAEIDPALPTRLTAIVDRAIAKSPAKRYQSLRKMHNDIAGVRQLLGSGEIESTIPVSPIPARPATTTVPDIVPIDPRDIAQRREDALRAHLTSARDALGHRDYKRAVEEAMQAAVFGIEDARVQQLLDQINTLQRAQQIAAWLQSAREHLDRGNLTEVRSLSDRVLETDPGNTDASRLVAAVEQTRTEREQERQIADCVDAARASGIRGDLTHALEHADRALELDPTNPTAAALRQELERARAERDERQARAAARAAVLDRGQVVEIDEAGRDTSDNSHTTFRRPSEWHRQWPVRAIALATMAAATGMFVANRFGVDQTDPRPPVDVVDAVPMVDVADAVQTDGMADPVHTVDVVDAVQADGVVDTAPEGDTEQLTDTEADGTPRTSPDRPDVSAALQRAQAVLESRRFDEAASAFQSVLARDPSSQAARDGLVEANAGAHLAQVNQLLGRAEAAFALGDLTTTRATYEAVLTVAPDDERARAGLDAVGTAEALMRGEPTDDIAERIAAARRAFEDGDLATARDEYGKVLAADPDNTPARTGLEAVREAEAIINRPE